MNYYLHLLKAKEYAEKATDYNNRRGLLDWAYSRLSGLPTNGELAEINARKFMQEKELWEQLETPFEKLSEYRANYKVVIPTQKKSERIIATRRNRFSNL